MDSITSTSIADLEAAGRTILNTITVQLAERAGLGSTGKLITGGKLRPDRLDVISAMGPFGPEVVIWPLMASTTLVGEYHAQIRGALIAPANYGETMLSQNWHSPNDEIKQWLRSNKFEAHRLPNQLKQGLVKVTLESVVELYAEATDRSRLAISMGGFGGMGSVEKALAVVNSLAPSVAQSSAPGPSEPLGDIRYGAIADAAISGELFEAAAQPTPDQAPARVNPADRAQAIIEAASAVDSKRVVVGNIDDSKMAKNLYERVATGANPASFLAFFDTGIRPKGKAGIAFFEEGIYVSETGQKATASYEEISGVSSGSGKVKIEVPGKGTIELLTSNDTDIVMSLLAAATGR